jgi:arylsulfatase A-like enzyme
VIEQDDLVVLVTDQERAAPPYESDSVKSWRRRELTAHQWFAENSVDFKWHYAGATACTPSRPTLLTGQYPAVHGVSQTTGISKHSDDPRMRWLRQGEVPTVGDWFGAAGFDVHYEGKWHMSDADLRDPETGGAFPTNRRNGEEIPAAVDTYLEAQQLAPFGFEGWVGPEPHGARTSNSGLVRDRITADRVVAWLNERNSRRTEGHPDALRPFLLIVCFVNPHDIVFWPRWAKDNPLEADPADPPLIGDAPSQHEDLADKPAIHVAHRRAYPTAYGQAHIVRKRYDDQAEEYRRTYYRLILEVDRQIERVRQAVLDGPRADSTTLLLTSDHGELLGSHGGLHQKWFNLFEETVRVPLFVSGPKRSAASYEEPTSHVDLVPTLMSLAGIDEAQVALELAATHSEVHPLPGRDLTGVISGGAERSVGEPVYFVTRDNILEGADTDPLVKRAGGRLRKLMPTRIEQLSFVATNLEGIVVRLGSTAGDIWKVIRVFDDPNTWSEPGVRNVVPRFFNADEVRTVAFADQWELYNLTDDPAEERNLASDDSAQSVLAQLRQMLEDTRASAVPTRNSAWPYAPA